MKKIISIFILYLHITLKHDYMEKTFTTLPNELITTDGIKLDHVIVYLMCKSHMNYETRKCYPSLTTLSKKCKIGSVKK